jgi:hypothetical protein
MSILSTLTADLTTSVISYSTTATSTLSNSKTFASSSIPISSVYSISSVISGVPARSQVPKYKTVYVTKTAEPNHNAGSPDLPSGAIAGIVVGAVAGLALLVGLVYFLLRRRQRHRSQAMESIELPSTSGSQSSTVVAEKSSNDVFEAYGTRDQNIYEMPAKVVYEMPASVAELDGRSLRGSLKPPSVAMIAARNIMSRGRPIKRPNR